MAILLIKRQDNNVPDTPGKWRAGEIVTVRRSSVPILTASRASNVVTVTHDGTESFTDSETVTFTGFTPETFNGAHQVTVVNSTTLTFNQEGVDESATGGSIDPGFGGAELPSAGNFYHVEVTNRTVAQVQNYMDNWKHSPTMSVVLNAAPNYRVRMESPMASVSGIGAIIRTEVEDMLTELTNFGATAASYHDHGRTGNTAWFEFNVTAPTVEIRDACRDYVEEWASELPIRRRRWKINAAGLAFLAANGGTVSGTAAQVAGYITDALTE